MARIIDLKNKRPQSQGFTPQSKMSEPGAIITAAKPRRFIGPRFIQLGSGLEPQKNPPPSSQVTAGPKTQMLNWSGPLFIHRPDMKIIAAISLTLFAIAVLTQIFQKNIITTIFFGLLGVVILIRAGKKPEIVNFEIGPLGVKVGERLFGFREIKSFWIEYNPVLGIKELSLQLKKWYYTYVKIPIYDQNPVQLRLTLLAFLPEVEHEDTLADAISRKLGI